MARIEIEGVKYGPRDALPPPVRATGPPYTFDDPPDEALADDLTARVDAARLETPAPAPSIEDPDPPASLSKDERQAEVRTAILAERSSAFETSQVDEWLEELDVVKGNGGWYTLPDGSKHQGRIRALQAAALES